MAALVDTRSHFLHLPFAQPIQLNGEGAAFEHTGFLGVEKFACFCWCTRHQRLSILISYVDNHGGCKPSFRSKVLLTTVEMAFYDPHTFRFRVPLMKIDSCT